MDILLCGEGGEEVEEDFVQSRRGEPEDVNEEKSKEEGEKDQ